MPEPNGETPVNYEHLRLGRALSLCPNAAKHTKCPELYLQWHSWAMEKMKTHRTKRCPGCGLYMIWVKKARHA